ncbi:MAG: ABC transporter ATP-binding protein [Pirellulaceae bacterium]
MSDIAISVENLSKRFHIGTSGGPGYHRLSEALTGLPRYAWSKIFSPRPASCEPSALAAGSSSLQPPASSLQPVNEFWALKDVSFEVKQGEVVGIIGRNGAGKSTLLKILSRITEPTSGRFGVRGRVASLLEVGTGFHPELTGRENIFVSGITLGMTRAEIKKRFDEIVDFSGVEKFLDTPVKRYSSGMQVRLGFAVAAHLESEILIVDEVLAVGDAEFQKKCIGKLEQLSHRGRTVVLVSHSMSAVTCMCSHAILIANGRVEAKGNVGEVLERYQSKFNSNIADSKSLRDLRTENVFVSGASVYSSGGDSQEITITRAIVIEFSMVVCTSGNLFNPSVVLENDSGVIVLNSFPSLSASVFQDPLDPGVYKCRLTIPPNLLNDELYKVSIYIIRDRQRVELLLENVLKMQPRDDTVREQWYGKWPGVVRPSINWHTDVSADYFDPP